MISRADVFSKVPPPSETCSCCRDVQICGEILRRANNKMNTLMQHVNMLCVLEGVKEVLPRPYVDIDDDIEVYDGDEQKAVMLRALPGIIKETQGEMAAIKRTISGMTAPLPSSPSSSHLLPIRRTCPLSRCFGSKRRAKMVTAEEFEEDMAEGNLIISSLADIDIVRAMLQQQAEVPLCETHWASHIENIQMDYEDDSEEVRRLKEALALPSSFEPSYGKRRRLQQNQSGEEGGSAVAEVCEDLSFESDREEEEEEEDDGRALSNNELLQRLLGGAIAGRVTGEIGDNGEVLEGEEHENQEEAAEDDTQSED